MPITYPAAYYPVLSRAARDAPKAAFPPPRRKGRSPVAPAPTKAAGLPSVIPILIKFECRALPIEYLNLQYRQHSMRAEHSIKVLCKRQQETVAKPGPASSAYLAFPPAAEALDPVLAIRLSLALNSTLLALASAFVLQQHLSITP